MHAIDLRHLPALLTGHISLVDTPEGKQPLRLPASETHLYDMFNQLAARLASGVRLRLITDATRLKLTTVQRQSYMTQPNQWPAHYDLFIDDEPNRRVLAAGGVQFGLSGAAPGDPTAILDLPGLPAGEKRLELWLPPMALVTIAAVEIDSGARWSPWPDQSPRIVFHGSSITHGVEADAASDAWPAIAARLAGAQMLNLGWAGSCLISGLAARIIRDQPADLIVLELGINVHGEGLLKARTFLSSVHSLLSIVREAHAATPIAIVSPIYCPAAETIAQGDGLTLVQMRDLLEQAVNMRKAAGDDQLFYISGLDLLGENDAGDLADGLHPNSAGYRKMGSRFHAQAKSLGLFHWTVDSPDSKAARLAQIGAKIAHAPSQTLAEKRS
jgi:lysophospholipase L1-like esterase